MIHRGMLEVIRDLLPNGVQHGSEFARFRQLEGVNAAGAGRVHV